jgi:hypothetical protein
MARSARSLLTGTLAIVCLLVTGAPPASAAGNFPMTFPAGTACPGFDVVISGTGGNFTTRSFVNGRTVTAGTGSSLVFTNRSTGQTFTSSSNGAAQQTTTNADGTQTVTAEGHNVLILFPTDAPAGPSTTLIVGRLVYNVDAAGNFTVKSITGTTTNICSRLS